MFSTVFYLFFQVVVQEATLLQANVYPVVRGFIGFCVMVVIFLMLLRLIFNYADPNPFGMVGRFAFKIKKLTDKFVYPIAKFLAERRVNTKIAPLIAMLGFIVVAYFTMQLFFYFFFAIDNVIFGIQNARITRVVGGILFGILGIYSLLIVFRIILSWITSYHNKILRFLMRLTDPVLEPFRRLIPPFGMFDLSPIIVLLILNFLQMAVQGVLLSN
jgi:YggT family protein